MVTVRCAGLWQTGTQTRPIANKRLLDRNNSQLELWGHKQWSFIINLVFEVALYCQAQPKLNFNQIGLKLSLIPQ